MNLSNIDSPDLDGKSGLVLIVDDIPANVRLLSGILKVAGYDIATASHGSEALDQVAAVQPDVVLLDVMMPGMDGFEVCRRIKADPSTAYLPVVLVTALQETVDRVTGLEAGADDFLIKPVEDVEVLARVKSLVRLKRQHDNLDQAYRELRRLESLRDTLNAMLVHDLRTPLTTLLAPLDMLRNGQLGPLDKAQLQVVELCQRSGQRLLALVNQLLDYHKLEAGEMKLERVAVRVDQVVSRALEEIALLTHNNSMSITCDIALDLPVLNVDDDLIRRTVLNLVGNAIKFASSVDAVSITAHQADGAMVVSVHDDGPGIPPGDETKIFDKFGQVEANKMERQRSSGIGLAFCKLAVEAHGGRIWVESAPGQGSTFRFTIPLAT